MVEVVVAVASAVVTLGAQLGVAFARRRISGRPAGVRVDASFHVIHNCVCITVTNESNEPVEITRIVAQFHQGRPSTRIGMREGKFFLPMELGWASMWPIHVQGTNPNLVLPGASTPFTAGNEWISKQVDEARWLTLVVTLGNRGSVKRKLSIGAARKWWLRHATPAYKPKPGEKLVPSSSMSMVIPSYPPRWVPAQEIVPDQRISREAED